MFVDEKRVGEVSAPVVPWRQLLLAAADTIERVGWVRGCLHADNGRVCALGAMNDVYAEHHDEWADLSPPNGELQEAIGHLVRYLYMRGQLPQLCEREPDDIGSWWITYWNDCHAASQDAVIKTMRECGGA